MTSNAKVGLVLVVEVMVVVAMVTVVVVVVMVVVGCYAQTKDLTGWWIPGVLLLDQISGHSITACPGESWVLFCPNIWWC